MPETNEKNTKNLILLAIAFAAAAVGAYFATLLTYHYQGHSSGLVSQICGTGADSACDKVQKSDLSSLFSMPIAFWGLLFYLTSMILMIWVQVKHDLFLAAIALNLAVAGIAFDIFLLIYSVFFVGGICPMCAITYICSLFVVVPLIMHARANGYGLKDAYKIPAGRTLVSWLVVGLTLLAAPAGSLLVHADAVKKKPAPRQLDANDPNSVLRKAYEQFYDMYMKNPKVLNDSTGSTPKGAQTAKITIVEFADTLCPYCKLMGERLSAFVNRHPADVKVIFRHYPLDSTCNTTMKRQMHAGSCDLSQAMYCGQEQGKFWPVHDAVFQSQAKFQSSPVTYAATEELAVQSGLDKAKFKACMGSAAAKKAVARDLDAGAKLKIQGTPTIYVNGRLMPGIHIEFVDGFFEYLLERVKAGK